MSNKTFTSIMEKLQAEAELDYKERQKLPDSDFVFPKDRAYPIHDKAHARNALARVAQHGTPDEKAKVKAAVKKRYPDIEIEEGLVEEREPYMGGGSNLLHKIILSIKGMKLSKGKAKGSNHSKPLYKHSSGINFVMSEISPPGFGFYTNVQSPSSSIPGDFVRIRGDLTNNNTVAKIKKALEKYIYDNKDKEKKDLWEEQDCWPGEKLNEASKNLNLTDEECKGIFDLARSAITDNDDFNSMLEDWLEDSNSANSETDVVYEVQKYLSVFTRKMEREMIKGLKKL